MYNLINQILNVMNRNVLKSVAVVAAFLIGVSINDSCGDSPYGGDTAELWSSVRSLTSEVDVLKKEIEELREMIGDLEGGEGYMKLTGEVAELRKENTELRDEITRLKQEVADLGNGEGNASGEFLVDGLYFSRGGYVSSKLKKQTSGDAPIEYHYDSQGRLKAQKTNGKGFTITNEYSYSGKTVTFTQATIYDPSVYPNSKNTSGTAVIEYY